MNSKAPYVVLDLFCGAGGMSEGFLQAGFSVPFAVDSSREAALTYVNRHTQLGYSIKFHNGYIQTLLNEQELNKFLGGQQIDVVTGGPPCQGFSTAGKRAEDDYRNVLFLEFLKMVKVVQPKYFVMENVEGILSYQFPELAGLDGEVYVMKTAPDIIVQEALKFGYFVKYKLLNAKHYGVPQHRPRVIFFGHKVKLVKNNLKDLVVAPHFPLGSTDCVTVEDAISDLRFLHNGQTSQTYDNRFRKSAYQLQLRRGCTPSASGSPIEATVLGNHQASKHSDVVSERFSMLDSGESVGELLKRLPPDKREKYRTKKQRCTKLLKDSVAPTVVTLPDDLVHYDPTNPRILTVRELARIQSFDDSFVFLGNRTTGGERRKLETPQYTQVGNAVPPLFARAIAKQIMSALQETHLRETEVLGAKAN